jgi:phosphoglucosamine mutase
MLRDGVRLFGTDGVRGVANTELTPDFALQLGRAAGSLLAEGPALVGRDTRRSGEMLSSALQAGFHSAGIDTVDVGVLTSGGISLLTGLTSAELGVVVSASHNPAADNGIKLLGKDGTKLSDEQEDRIEQRLRSTSGRVIPFGGAVGTRFPMADALDRYVGELVKGSAYTFNGLSLALDCANGAAFRAAPALFRRLKADVAVYADVPDGTNINDGCGATHPEFLAAQSIGRIGLAFDGDADRLIAVDEQGSILNGDVIMAVIARHWKRAGKLKNDTVVATVMSNLGFRRAMHDAGVRLIETRVGDRYVLEAMRASKAILGGEQSGHVIFLDRGRTGDGLLTGVRLLEVVAGTGKTLAELRREAMSEFPQVLVNVRVARREALDGAASVWEAVRRAEEALGEEGRVLVRASGTEPLVRVMVEASGEDVARRYADQIAGAVRVALGEEG